MPYPCRLAAICIKGTASRPPTTRAARQPGERCGNISRLGRNEKEFSERLEHMHRNPLKKGLGNRDSGFGIRGSGFGVRDSGFGARESGLALSFRLATRCYGYLYPQRRRGRFGTAESLPGSERPVGGARRVCAGHRRIGTFKRPFPGPSLRVTTAKTGTL